MDATTRRTPARYDALKWFLDHEMLGPDSVLTRPAPTARMRRLMAKDGDVVRLPLGQFEMNKWRLTPQGRTALLQRPVPKTKGTKP